MRGERLRFSANTGFLYPELDFLERIRAAARDGFDAVEFHDEGQRTDRAALEECLAECGLPVLGLNVAMAPTAGCAAIPGMEDKARRDIDAALALADDIDAAAVHVLAGRTDAPEAREVFLGALEHALDSTDRTILVEPLCTAAMAGYWLHDLDVAAGLVDDLNRPNMKILFDCFHVEMQHGGTLARLREHVARVGHVQIASVPARAEPTTGATGASGADGHTDAGAPAGDGDRASARPLDYARLLPAIRAAGYTGAFGCEYKPALSGAERLAWRRAFDPEETSA